MAPAPRDSGGGGGGPPSWETPPEVFDPLDHVWAFTLDGAAEEANRKVDRWASPDGTFHMVLGEAHGIDHSDGLTLPWHYPERIWINPPWNDVMPWVRKAALSALRDRATVVALLPARTDGAWFHRWVKPYADITFLEGRIKFIHPPVVCGPRCEERGHGLKKPGGGPPEGAMICVYR